MIACPFCHFENEKGSLFCEQCKSDLSSDAPASSPASVTEVAAIVEESAPTGEMKPPLAVVVDESASAAVGESDRTVENALAPGARAKLRVVRGLKPDVEYPIVEGANHIGRRDERAVDIDLEDQEPDDKVWSSRQHAVIHFEGGLLSIEDLKSSNGTFVNRSRIAPGVRVPLKVNDILHIGTVQLRVVCEEP